MDFNNKYFSAFEKVWKVTVYLILLIIRIMPLAIFDFHYLLDLLFIILIAIPNFGGLVSLILYIISFFIVISNPIGTVEIIYFVCLGISIFTSNIFVGFIITVTSKIKQSITSAKDKD